MREIPASDDSVVKMQRVAAAEFDISPSFWSSMVSWKYLIAP
jgi:hypothetical protein